MATVFCIGIATLDYIYGVTSIPTTAEKHRAHSLAVIGGGLSGNASVAVARLGGTALLSTRLGADAIGHEIVAGLESEGVDCRFTRRFAGQNSHLSTVVVDDAGERMVISYGDPAMPTATDWLPTALPDGVDAVLGDNRWEQGAAHMFALARAAGKPALLDCDRAPRDLGLLALPSHVAFSAQGLREVTGVAEAAGGLRALRAGGLTNRLMATVGADGVLVLEDDGAVRHIPGYLVTVVDTLAAGDVWHGAFALALAEHMAEAAALVFANAAAALKCTRFGGRAGTPSRADVVAFLAARHAAVSTRS